MKKTKLISLLLSGLMLLTPAVGSASQNDEYDQFERIMNYAANLYIDDSANADELMAEAVKRVVEGNPELMTKLIKAGFSSLDEYTEFYTAEEFELFNKNLNHIVYGIGVTIQQVGDYVTVMSVIDGGGAQEAGVKSGDKIARVDGVDVKGQSLDKVQDLILGEPGTEVTVTFLRGETEIEYTIVRREVTGETVSGTVLDGNIGYIDIINFAAKTSEEFAKVLAEFDAAGVKDIIIDLRDNPGGYLESAVEIARMIVPKGVIVSTVYRSEFENETFYSDLPQTKYNIAVLVNENTASSSEVLSSALKDSGAAILVGDTTYGKGVIQQMFEIWDGCAFKITTGKYFTRNGEDINGNGIEPDEFVENSTRRIDITRYPVFDYKTKPHAGESSPNVKAAKERLRLLGYYSGTADEEFDSVFEQAVYKFQEKNDLYPYGVLDISTQVKMENMFYKLEELVDNQLIWAYEYFGGKAENLYKSE